jgi:hypothetical protein
MPSQSTAVAYRILTRRQRRRRGWRTIRLTPKYRIAFDPTIYSNVMFPPHPALRECPDGVEVVTTEIGDLGLSRLSS